jgi:photosystem II stability/assembly factor-like uncharacterized protein
MSLVSFDNSIHLDFRHLLAITCAFFGIAGFAADPSPALSRSERMPLSPKSLLLDIAVLKEEVVVVGERGHILKSRDDGLSWRQIITPTRATLTNIEFVDDRHGWASGHSGIILSTTDSGDSWDLISEPDPEISYFDALFFDTVNGLFVGAYGEYAKSNDAGVTLEKELIDEEDLHFYGISKSPNGTLYIVGEKGQILRSINQGLSWEKLDFPYEGSLFGILCLDDKTLLTYGLRGHIFRSNDTGENWQSIEQAIPVMLTAGIELSSGHIIISGIAEEIFMSTDRGQTFYPIEQSGIDGTVALAETANKQAILFCGRHGVLRVKVESLESALRKSMLTDE